MQPRTLEQILSELDSASYAKQEQNLRQRQSSIPGQIQEEERGLQARQDTAFGDILNGARRRGLGFSGIPLAEQARYTADNYLPALARLRQQGKEQAMSLEDAILGIQERKRAQAQSIFENERNFAEQRRQFDEQQRFAREQAARQAAQAAANQWAPTNGYNGGQQGGGGQAPAPKGGKYGFKNGKNGMGGFYFQDDNGNAISAAQYAIMNGKSPDDIIRKMASAGDEGAMNYLNYRNTVLGSAVHRRDPNILLQRYKLL